MKRRVFLSLLAVLGFCAPVLAQVTDLYLDASFAGSIGDGQSVFYRLEMPSPAHLVLLMQNGDGRSRHHLYIQKDTFPTTEDYLAVSANDIPEQVIEIPQLEPGTYFVMVRGVYTYRGQGYSITATSQDPPQARVQWASI